MWPKDNPGSWQDIHNFIEEFPEDAYWSKWKRMARELVDALEARGLAKQFRIGQSMHHIILSTTNHHGLKLEPRVTLGFHPKEQVVRIAYSCAPLEFHEPLSQEHVPPDSALSVTLVYLQRLWIETKPTLPIPDGLVLKT